MFNIVVDPGEGAVNNLYAMGLSISDIDMVIATHDHPEHLAALDAILWLRREFQRRQRAKSVNPARAPNEPADPGDEDEECADPRDENEESADPRNENEASAAKERLLILGNRSVVNRYSFLNGNGKNLVQHIADASVLGGGHVPSACRSSS